ncbi:3-oxoacyl-ACP reductase [Hoeflea sp. BAL378]|uniref:SDR family NAD(P)-dependent oxidoreductase n=1 Tax=Hoeflea sp. BAL378 TaxID=1547437 RepID=UPI000512F0B5|nr:SDR family oxidoreductase [Hoeflea sp. BAL378]KGF70728.1 3-oxoacyl-ACP reductase [Hoeflea sp. BAL378]
MNPFDFSGKTVLVVGGSSGIGNGIAQAFRAYGADVLVWGTRASAADYDGVEGSNLSGLAYTKVDVRNDAEVEDAAGRIPKLDVLIMAQGAVEYKRREFEMESFRRVIDVNLSSVMLCATTFHQRLKQASGSIVVIGSIGALKAVKGNPAYAASKAAVHALARTLGDAWGGDGIRVNVLAPGMVATKMTGVTVNNPDRLNAALGTISLGRLGTVEDMAGPALFLSSPLAAYITGQTLVVDGGRIL